MPLYVILRPWRLLRTHGLGLRLKPVPDLSPFARTRADVVDRMLQFAHVRPGDVLCDLGCGDGQIVVTAAKKFGIRTIGVDIDSQRVAEARSNARRNGVAHLVEI